MSRSPLVTMQQSCYTLYKISGVRDTSQDGSFEIDRLQLFQSWLVENVRKD